jgi:phenylpropionate dioxygenase-like ring-hydroxylating dioxygenase large terminal subunit
MERQEELAVGRRLLTHIDGRTTDLAGAMFRNRVAAYSCRERASLERERLFRDQPIFMGLASRLAKPGDYLSEDVAGMPVLMTRGVGGRVMAFANICRHRGAPVAQGCGNARAFTCPYHGWTYDLAGRLLGTTDKVGFAGIDLASHGLVRLPAAERHGMLFVRPKLVQPGESVEIDVDASLGPLAADLAALRLETYPMFSADRINPRINWKFAIDTFLEGYHIPHLHRKTIAPYFIGNCGTFDGAGLHGRMCVARTSIEGVRGLPEGERNYRPHVISIYQLFPNTIVIWQVDHLARFPRPRRRQPLRCRDDDLQARRQRQVRRLLGEEPRHRHPHRDGGGLPAGRAHADRFRIGRHRRGDLRPQRAVAGPFPYVDPQRARCCGIIHWTAGLQARS